MIRKSNQKVADENKSQLFPTSAPYIEILVSNLSRSLTGIILARLLDCFQHLLSHWIFSYRNYTHIIYCKVNYYLLFQSTLKKYSQKGVRWVWKMLRTLSFLLEVHFASNTSKVLISPAVKKHNYLCLTWHFLNYYDHGTYFRWPSLSFRICVLGWILGTTSWDKD